MDVAVSRRLSRAQHHREIVGIRFVVQEEILNGVSLVSQTEHKLPMSPRGVILHDVPQDGTPADWYHRLGDVVSHIADPGPEAAREDHSLHLRLAEERRSAPYQKWCWQTWLSEPPEPQPGGHPIRRPPSKCM